jgi:hypothetical protein
MSAVPQPPPPPPSRPAPPRIGRLTGGVLIVLLGVGWLLEVLDVTEFPWDVLLPVALVLVGGALILTSRSASGHGGLIATGVVLTVLLVFGSAIDFPLEGGVGDRLERPRAIEQLRGEYRLGVGELTLDLVNLSDLAADDRTRARVGIGRLVVIVPDGMTVLVEARASLGNVRVFDVEEGGFDVERVVGPGPDAGLPLLQLELSVGIGEVEVRRG